MFGEDSSPVFPSTYLSIIYLSFLNSIRLHVILLPVFSFQHCEHLSIPTDDALHCTNGTNHNDFHLGSTEVKESAFVVREIWGRTVARFLAESSGKLLNLAGPAFSHL